MVKTVEWKDNRVVMIDQRLLPGKVVYRRYTDHRQVAKAIKDMVVRGAPAIGVAAAMGFAAGARRVRTKELKAFKREIGRIARTLASARPTAVNLFWAIERMNGVVEASGRSSVAQLKKKLVAEARKIHREDIAANKLIGKRGARLIKNGSTVLTHCNAGALATAGYGTALGVIRGARAAGKKVRVFVDETRPFLQGTRLTAWELQKDGFDVTLITDNMAGYMMGRGLIDSVVVGSDRIAANGDVANKIGTYSVAILARAHGIPFYVAAPSSTIDPDIKRGDDIPIEERPAREVTHAGKTRLAPKGIKVRNPAFDVTPARLVTAIITERGVLRRPYTPAIKRLFAGGKKGKG
ncbi:MAG: S-methyl-5-thioribose-1-phosphate isomerase [Thermodesulfobacteriota bacterium]